jgi:ABC-type multidrug transport system ATPase subunit
MEQSINPETIKIALLEAENDVDPETIKTPFLEDRTENDRPGIAFSNINFIVGRKKILSNISGTIGSGEFCCILGPSGSGKTSLLNALAGRLEGSQGSILYGGCSLAYTKLRTIIAFLQQEDCLCPTQTPREALLFSAVLRLPRTMLLTTKKALVEEMLSELRLLNCADTLLGDRRIRGCSVNYNH